MVQVVTNQAADTQHADEIQSAEALAAEEMAKAAQNAPVEEPAEEPAPSSDTSEWEDLLTDDDDETLPEEIKADVPAEEITEVPPVEPPTEVIPSVETPPVEEVVPVVETPPVDEVVPPVEEPLADTRTSEQVQTEIKAARESAHEKLTESFKWTDEQAEQFEADPGAVMSSMAAKLFLDLYDSISQGFNANMPGMVQRAMQQQQANQAAEKQFFGAWPQLDKPEYKATVDRIAIAYRQQNPTIDDVAAVKEIGAQAWVALQLPLDQLVAHTQAAPPVVPPVVIPVPAHVPASAGNAPQNARTLVKPTGNPFEVLADELIEEDAQG